MSEKKDLSTAIKKVLGDDAQIEAPETDTTEQEVLESFKKHFEGDSLRDIAGREITTENQRFPGAVVKPMAALAKGEPPRYSVEWDKDPRTGRYRQREMFKVGQKLDDMLPDYLQEELQETLERLQVYIETNMGLSRQMAEAQQTAFFLRKAVAACASKEQIAENPHDFRVLMQARQGDLAQMEASWMRAKFEYAKQFMDCAWFAFCSNVQMWLGCMLPIGMVSHPASKPSGEFELNMNLEVVPLSLTQDKQEKRDYECTPDLRWQDTQLYLMICPEQQTESFYRQAARKTIGPSVDKSAPMSVGDGVPVPAGAKRLESGLIVKDD